MLKVVAIQTSLFPDMQVSEKLTRSHRVIHNGILPPKIEKIVGTIVRKAGGRFQKKVFTFYVIENKKQLDVWVGVSGMPSKRSVTQVLIKNIGTAKDHELNRLEVIPFVHPEPARDVVITKEFTDSDQARMFAFFLVTVSGSVRKGSTLPTRPDLKNAVPHIKMLAELFVSEEINNARSTILKSQRGSLSLTIAPKYAPGGFSFASNTKLPFSIMRGKQFQKNTAGKLKGTIAIDWDKEAPASPAPIFDRDQKQTNPIDKWLFVMRCLSDTFLFLDQIDLLINEAKTTSQQEALKFYTQAKEMIVLNYAQIRKGLIQEIGPIKYQNYQNALNALIKELPSLSIDALASLVHSFRQCGEDNLVSFLRKKPDILKSPGNHYIFSILPKESVTKIAPPCDKCKMQFSKKMKSLLQRILNF